MSIVKNIVNNIVTNIAKPITGEVSQSGESGSYILNVDKGSFTFTGYDPDLRRFKLEADKGSFTFTGYDPNLRRERILNVDKGSFTFTGYDPDLQYSAGADADATAIMDEFNSNGWTTTSAQEAEIEDLVVALKDAGVWSKLDSLYLIHAANLDSACIDWKDPTGTKATQVNSPAFTAYQGINLGPGRLELATELVDMTNFTANNNHIGVFGFNSAGDANSDIYASDSGNSEHQVFFQVTATELGFRHDNRTVRLVSNVVTSDISVCITRTSTNSVNCYIDGVSEATFSDSPEPLASSVIEVPDVSTVIANHYVQAWHAGDTLTSTEVSDLTTAINTYLTNQTA